MATTSTPAWSTGNPVTGNPMLDSAIIASGIRWRRAKLQLVDVLQHLQHRHADVLDKRTVTRYTNMAKAGNNAPEVIVTRDGVLAAGNHRFEGYSQAGRTEIDSIELDVDGIGADDHTMGQLISIAVAENAPHGLPYSTKDRQDRAADLVGVGYNNTAIQAMLGLSPSQVSGIKREVEAKARLDSLGIEEPKRMAQATLRALAGPDARALNSGPFKDLVDLADDARMTSTEVNALAKEAREAAAAGGDADAVKVLADRRNDLAQHISQIATGGQSRPTPAGKLASATKAVGALCDGHTTAKTYRDHSDKAVETVVAVASAIKCLENILAAQDPDAITEAQSQGLIP